LRIVLLNLPFLFRDLIAPEVRNNPLGHPLLPTQEWPRTFARSGPERRRSRCMLWYHYQLMIS
jgi:hypothetical protein